VRSVALVGDEDQGATSLQLKLFLLGFLLMFAGIIVLVIAALLRDGTSISGGLIIIVGFIPIVLGVGPHAFLAVLVATILTIIAFVVFLCLRKQAAKG